jgi:hypothetical protein
LSDVRSIEAAEAVPAPDGSTVRPLCLIPDAGSFAHFELEPGMTSRAVSHATVQEIWYVIAGTGEMWRSRGGNIRRCACVRVCVLPFRRGQWKAKQRRGSRTAHGNRQTCHDRWIPPIVVGGLRRLTVRSFYGCAMTGDRIPGIRGRVVQRGDPGYVASRAIWNAQVDRWPTSSSIVLIEAM